MHLLIPRLAAHSEAGRLNEPPLRFRADSLGDGEMQPQRVPEFS